MSDFAVWLASRPKPVRRTLARWPIGSVVTDGSRRFFVFGATENGSLIITPVDPHIDYEGAVAQRLHACSKCLASGRLHRIGEAHT